MYPDVFLLHTYMKHVYKNKSDHNILLETIVVLPCFQKLNWNLTISFMSLPEH